MSDIRKLVYDTLTADTALCALLATPTDSIYMSYSVDAGTYPVIVISMVDDVPAFHADNIELASIVRFQISIITEDAEYDTIEDLVKNDLINIGAMRSISTEYREKNLHYRILQFRIANT